MNRDEILKTNKHYWDTYADLWFGTTALPAYGNIYEAMRVGTELATETLSHYGGF